MNKPCRSDWIDRMREEGLEEREIAHLLDKMNQNPKLRLEMELDTQLERFLSNREAIELRRMIVRVSKRPGRKHVPVRVAAAVCTLALLLTGMLVFLLNMCNTTPPAAGKGHMLASGHSGTWSVAGRQSYLHQKVCSYNPEHLDDCNCFNFDECTQR